MMMADETKPAEPEKPAETTKPADPPAAPDPTAAELAELRAYKAEQEKARAAAEKAKLTEAERLKAEREELKRERFLLEVERSGVPLELVEAVNAGDPKKIERAYKKAIEAAITASKTKPAGTQINPDTGATPKATPSAASDARYLKLAQGKRG